VFYQIPVVILELNEYIPVAVSAKRMRIGSFLLDFFLKGVMSSLELQIEGLNILMVKF
jgi:hypothetical protein